MHQYKISNTCSIFIASNAIAKILRFQFLLYSIFDLIKDANNDEV